MINFFNLAKSLLYALFIFLGIKTGTVMVLFALMTVDSLLGIIKALRLGKKFSFKILAWGAVSKLTILIIPMILALMGRGLSFDFTYFVVVVLNIIIVSEGLSCITNIISIKTKKQVENSDYITVLLNTIRKALTKMVNKFLGVLTDGKNDNNNNNYDSN